MVRYIHLLPILSSLKRIKLLKIIKLKVIDYYRDTVEINEDISI
jgi:hypothetical protein